MNEKINLEIFLNHLRNAVVMADTDGTIRVKNAAFSALFGRELGGGTDKKLFHVLKNNPEILESVTKVIEIRGSYYLRDVPVMFEHKPARSMDVETFPITSEVGILLCVTIMFRDRAGLVRFEEHARRAERVNYLGTISSGLAHEIKNPLSGIKGASQLLTRELEGRKDLKEYAEIIQKEVTRVDKLLSDLLHFSKSRVLQKKKTNVNQVLHDIILLQKTVAAQRIECVEQFDPSLPPVVADESSLSQLFLNLIKNARQAIKDKGKLTVRSRMVTDFGLKTRDVRRQVIAVNIEDTGEGMDADSLSKIFVPFYTTKPEGTGLGLALCQKIVSEHEGDIEVKSEKGRGTVFTVYLPV